MCAAMVDRSADYSYQRQYSPQPYHNEPDIRTSAFVSNSDKLHAERQERLKWEMKREYEDHMRRPSPGYREQEPPYYQPNVQQKDEIENKRREELYRRRNQSPAKPQTELYDHNEMAQQLREERRKEYNDHMQQKEQILNRTQRQLEPPVLDRRNQQEQPPMPDYRRSQDSNRTQRAPSGRWEPNNYRRETFAPNQRLLSPPHQSNMGNEEEYHSSRRKLEHENRRKEYNDFLERKKQQESDKKMYLDNQRRQPAAQVIKGDYYSSEEYSKRRQQLQEEEHKDYQQFLERKGFVPVNGITLPMDYDPKVWNEIQDQESRFSKTQRKPDSKVYQSAVRSILKGESNELPVTPQKKIDTDRPTEYYTAFEEPRGVKDKIEKRASDYSKHWIDGIDMDKVKIFPQGEYEEKHKHLQRQWKDSFKDTVAQQREKLIKEHETREAGKFMLENAVVESPRCIPTGEYEIKQQQFKDQLREECKSFLKRHIPKERSKEIWKENEQPRTVPQSGEYKNRRERLQSQLRQDFLDFYGQKKQQEYSRRNANFAEGNNTFFDSLGQSMDQKKEQLLRERNDDYRRHLQEKRERESSNRYPPNSVRRQDEPPRYQSPPREQRTDRERSGPGSYQNGPRTPSYQDMLEDKRRQEASYRRYEPEFARSSDRY